MYELVQVHDCGQCAEVVIRSKNGDKKVIAGNLTFVKNPKDYYPPETKESEGA